MKIIRLTIYDPTHIKLKQFGVPFGMNLTKWINTAMQEKLDRDNAGSTGQAAAVEQEPECKPIDPNAILAEMKRQEMVRNKPDTGPYVLYYRDNATMYGAAVHNHKTAGVKSLGIEGELEKMCSQDPAYVLSDEQKRAIMAKHGRKQVKAVAEVDPDAIPEDVRGHPIKYKEWREKKDAERSGAPLPDVSPTGELSDTAEYLALCKPVKPVPVAKLAEDEETDFWGDDEFNKVRANVRKHCK